MKETSTNWSCALPIFADPEGTRAKIKICFCFYFSGRTFGLGERGAHRQPQAGSTVLLQIQTGSFGEPPTPIASDPTLALDQY